VEAIKYLLVLLAVTSPCFAAAEIVIKVGVVGIAPFGYEESKGEHVDWWREISKRSNMKINIKLFPLPRLRKELESGRIDLAIYGPGKTPQPRIIKLFEHQKVNFVVFNKTHPGATISQLEGLVVGHIIGASGIVKLLDQVSFIPRPLTTYKSAIKMLAVGRINAIYAL